MELWLIKFTFGVGILAFCYVDWSCWGRPINSGDEVVAAVNGDGAAVPIEANVGVILVSVIGVVCIVLVLVGCLCCQKGVFKTFENLHNGPFRQGYVSQTSNEFTMFPPGGSSGQQRGSMADIKFEPLPDIRPRGRSLPTAQRPRPATFSNVINRGLSVQDWFDDPHVNFPRYQLQYLQELGSGWFGKVVEGEANGIGISPQKTKVVVKILREDATPTDQMYFLHEVKAFRDLNHPNIMKLLGKCLESDPFLIILEHCAFKDLKTYLTQHRTESESLIQGNLLLRMACNIAAGLHHMHSHGFIHTSFHSHLMASTTTMALAKMTTSTRSQTEVYLLGTYMSELIGSKLPSMRMALGFFLHHHLELKETIRMSSAATVTELAKFWQKAHIPMRDHQNCQTKLERLFEEWRFLKKNKGRKSATQKAKEEAFVSRLDDLFDVAHADAMNIMVIQEDKEFLLAQREKGRRGSMAGRDSELAAKEKRAAEGQQKMFARRRRMEDMKQTNSVTAELISSDSNTSTADEDADHESDDTQSRTDRSAGASSSQNPSPATMKRKRGRKIVISPQLAATLDRTKMSDRKAMFVIAETAKSLGKNIDDMALNRDTIRRLRMAHRAKRSASLKAEFQSDVPLIVHWDGKLIPDLTGKEKVDRLPVLISGRNVSQLLTVAKLPSGTGEAQATAVYDAIEDWGIASSIRAMCFDTTSSNTGRIAGACILLEQKLGKELLSLACRHHILELIIGAAFEACLGSTSSPEVKLFKRFQEHWGFIDTDKHQTGIARDDVAGLVKDIRVSVVEFALKQLEQNQPRDDYKEFLELAIIFLGAAPTRGVRFMSPGPMHHARWMSKVIYSLKVWMFQSQFKLTPREENGLRDMCVFVVRVYLKAWMTAPLAASAPHNDMFLLKSLLQYAAIHPAISKATSAKLSNHLWYLSEDLVGLAFFDSQVSPATKRMMVKALEQESNRDEAKRIIVALDTFTGKHLEDFVTANSNKLFELMELRKEFLSVDPEEWADRDDFKQARDIVQALKVVNDHAERGVALIQEFSGLITRDESQLQFLLQVVEDHRRAYPDSRKQTLPKRNNLEGDLAARNCLVNTDLQVKIGDYGNAIEKFRENYYCAGDVAVPIRWCAPESLRCTEMTIETKEVTKEANIWSFGIVLWEILEFGKLPYFELNDDDVLQKVIIDNATTLSQPRTAVAHKDRVYEVMKLCWLSDPQLRPNMEKVSAMLAHLHNHKDPDLSSEFEQRWNSLQPRMQPHPTRVGAGDATTNLAFESNFAASNVGAPGRRSLDWDTSSSMSPIYSLSLEGDFPETNGSTISPSLQNLRGSMDDLNAASSSSVGGGRSLAEQTSVSEGDLNDGSTTHESTPDLKARSASEDLLQQRRSEEHSPRKVQREFDAWLQQQQTQGAEASQMAQQISEAIGDLDQALASEKSSDSSSHHASPERDTTLTDVRQDNAEDYDMDEEEAERRWTEMVDGTTREAAQVTELVREKSQSVQDFLKLTVIDSDNSDSDLNTPRQVHPSSSAPALDDEGVLLHNITPSKLVAFATEVAGASVMAAVREASSPTPRSGNAPSPLLIVAAGAAALISADVSLAGAEMLNSGDEVSSISSQSGVVSETEQSSPVLSPPSFATIANDQPPYTNISAVTEASLTPTKVVLQPLDGELRLVEREQNPPTTDSSALTDFRLVLNDDIAKDLQPAVLCSNASSVENSVTQKSNSSVASAFHEGEPDGNLPHEMTDISSSCDVQLHEGRLASTPLRTVDEPDLSAYFANRTSDYLVNESNVDDMWALQGATTSRENVAEKDIALIVDSLSVQSSDFQQNIQPTTDSALILDMNLTTNNDFNEIQLEPALLIEVNSPAIGDDCIDSTHQDSSFNIESSTFFSTATDVVVTSYNPLPDSVRCTFDDETGEHSIIQSPSSFGGITPKNPTSAESTFVPIREYVSPRDFDSEASSATMYLTCDDSTQSSKYQTDSDASPATVDESSDNECVVESVKELTRTKRSASFNNVGSSEHASTVTSDDVCVDVNRRRDDLLVLDVGTAANTACEAVVAVDTTEVNPFDVTINSDCPSINSSLDDSREQEVLSTPHSDPENTISISPADAEENKTVDSRCDKQNSKHGATHCGDQLDSMPLLSLSSDAISDDTSAVEQLLCEATVLSSEMCDSPPSDDVIDHSISYSSNVPEEAGGNIALEEAAKDVLENSIKEEFLSESFVATHDINILEDAPEISNDKSLQDCGSISGNDKVMLAPTVDVDSRHASDKNSLGGDNQTMVLASAQDSWNLIVENKAVLSDNTSDHLGEAVCAEASLPDWAASSKETNAESVQGSYDHADLDNTDKEMHLKKPDVVGRYAETAIPDSSSEEEGPQEEARDSLSDGTFERATTPLVENAFTLDPVIPLQVTECLAETENTVRSKESISHVMSPSIATAQDNSLSVQDCLQLEDETMVVSPSIGGLDVMSGDTETVEFEFFVSADGNGNLNLQSAPCNRQSSTFPSVEQCSKEEPSSAGSDPKCNTFIKFDSDVTLDNFSDYGTNVEATSDNKRVPAVAASEDMSCDDEKHSEDSEGSSGLSTLYEIEDIEEALADVESSEDDSRQSGEAEDTEEVGELELINVKSAVNEYEFADYMYPDADLATDSSSDWNGNDPLMSSWHRNGLHNFVPLHSTIEEVSEEDDIPGLADRFQHALTRMVRRLSEVEMEMVSDENESPVLGIAPSPAKELAMSTEALKAVKGGCNGSSLIHDAVNEVVVSCVTDMLDNNLVLDDGKSLSFDRKKHELTLDVSPSINGSKSREDIVFSNNCRNYVLSHDASDDKANANTEMLEHISNVANGILQDKGDSIVKFDADSTKVNHKTKPETMPEALNSVTIEDLDIPRNGIEKVTYCPPSREDDDDVLIVDTETNEVTLLESNRPRPHLAFVRQGNNTETLQFQSKTSSDGEESESELSSSAAEDATMAPSKLVGSRFVVVPCSQTGVVIHEELDNSSASFTAPDAKSVTELSTNSTTSDSDLSANNAKIDLYNEIDNKISSIANEEYQTSAVEDLEPKIEKTEIAHTFYQKQEDDDEAQVDSSLSYNDDCIEKCVSDNLKSCPDAYSDVAVMSSELPFTLVGVLEPKQTCDEILNEVVQFEADVPATTDPSSLEGIIKFASMSTVDHETEVVAAAVASKEEKQVGDPESSETETIKATEGVVLDIMESDPEDELVALIPVCADASEISPSLAMKDDEEGGGPGVCYTPDWESDTDTASNQSSSSTSGEFEVNKSTKPSDASEDFTYTPLTNIAELPMIDDDDDHSDDELDAETRAALESFQPSEWNKNATPSRGLLRSPEKKSDGKKCVSFKMQKRQVIYEYPKEDKSWEEQHVSSRSTWSDQVYEPQLDYINSIDWELGDEEIPEDIVEVEDFDDGSHGYDPAPVFRLHDDALYRLSHVNYEEEAGDSLRCGPQNSSNGGNDGEVVMYDPESGGLTFEQLLEHYGNNPELFGSPPDGEEMWPGGAMPDSNFFVNCSSDDEDPFKMEAQQFYNAHYLPHYLMEAGRNYFSAGGSEGGEPDPRAAEGEEAYLGMPEADYMLHRFGPAAAGFHYYDPVMGVNMFVGNGENDETDFAEALDRMIQMEQNGGSQSHTTTDGNNGDVDDDDDSDEIPSFEVKPQQQKSNNAICDTNRPQDITTTTKTSNEPKSQNESGEHTVSTDDIASSINTNGIGANDCDAVTIVHAASKDTVVQTTTQNLSTHDTDSGLGTPSIEEVVLSPSFTTAASATAASSSVSLDASRTYPAAVELATSQELFI